MRGNRKAWLASSLLFAIGAANGCAYFNGIYNANAAAKTAARDLRGGRDSASRANFQLSAESAETVLVRHPNTRWRARALYLAGRGAALSGNCAAAGPRLEEFLALARPVQSRDDEKKRTAERNEAQRTLDLCASTPLQPRAADSLGMLSPSGLLFSAGVFQ